ncbi:MAG: hypothetical protein KF716_31510 [Anaerolineae bacterium]|nr:hypothetical protein [Anaerolineae bacterium]
MNHKINSQSRARLLVVLTALLVIALSAVTWQPATATVLSDNQQPAAPANQITTTTYEFEHSFLPAVRRTLTTSITDTEFGDDSVCIAVQVLAKNLKGFDIRAAVFFFYANGTAMESGDSSGEFATQSGYLTSQSVYTSGYTNSKWAGTFCVPYVFFPSVSVRTRGFIQAQSGVDGQEFVSFSGRAYFTISP